MEHETRFELAFPSRSATSHTRRSLIALVSPFRWQGDAGADFIEELRLERSYRYVSVNSGGRLEGQNCAQLRHAFSAGHRGWLQLVRSKIDANGATLSGGDRLSIQDIETLDLRAITPAAWLADRQSNAAVMVRYV
jgi:hypothetical protein